MRRTVPVAAALLVALLPGPSTGQDAPPPAPPASDVDAAVKRLVEAAATDFDGLKGDAVEDPDARGRPSFACTVALPGHPAGVLHPKTERQSAEVVVRWKEADEAAATKRFDEVEALLRRCVPEAWLGEGHIEQGKPPRGATKHLGARENPPSARRVAVTLFKKEDGFVVVLAIQGARPPRQPREREGGEREGGEREGGEREGGEREGGEREGGDGPH